MLARSFSHILTHIAGLFSCKRATNHRALLRKVTWEDGASYVSFAREISFSHTHALTKICQCACVRDVWVCQRCVWVVWVYYWELAHNFVWLCLRFYVSMCLDVCASMFLCVCVSACVWERKLTQGARAVLCLSVCLSVRLSICLSIYLSIFLSVCLFVYLSVCKSVSVCAVCKYSCVCF